MVRKRKSQDEGPGSRDGASGIDVSSDIIAYPHEFCQDEDLPFAYRLSGGWLLEVPLDEDICFWLESYANQIGLSVSDVLHRFILEGLAR